MQSERPVGMTVGPIPWSKVCAWAARHGLDADGEELLWEVIRGLDVDFLNGLAKKTKLTE